jgi:hypothetical protein
MLVAIFASLVLAFVNKLMMIEPDLVKQNTWSFWLKSRTVDGAKALQRWLARVLLDFAPVMSRAFQTARIYCVRLLPYSRPGSQCGLEPKVKLLFMRLLSWGWVGPCNAVIPRISLAGKAGKGLGPGLLSVSYALSKSEDQS